MERRVVNISVSVFSHALLQGRGTSNNNNSNNNNNNSNSSSGERGWDIFSLDYHVEAPISTVLTSSVMKQYLKIFNFLWRVKRVEHTLSHTWRLHMINGHYVRKRQAAAAAATTTTTTNNSKGKRRQKTESPEEEEGRSGGVETSEAEAEAEVYHLCHAVRNEMIHFVSNLQYYLMFEVLEGSWGDLMEQTKSAKHLDQLIDAHQKYLNTILEKSLLLPTMSSIQEELGGLLNVILQFAHTQQTLHAALQQQQDQQQANEDIDQYQKRLQKRWGVGDGNNNNTNDSSNMKQTTREVGVQVQELCSEYRLRLNNFRKSLLAIANNNDENLQFFTFRLDFNEFYERQNQKPPSALMDSFVQDDDEGGA